MALLTPEACVDTWLINPPEASCPIPSLIHLHTSAEPS